MFSGGRLKLSEDDGGQSRLEAVLEADPNFSRRFARGILDLAEKLMKESKEPRQPAVFSGLGRRARFIKKESEIESPGVYLSEKDLVINVPGGIVDAKIRRSLFSWIRRDYLYVGAIGDQDFVDEVYQILKPKLVDC